MSKSILIRTIIAATASAVLGIGCADPEEVVFHQGSGQSLSSASAAADEQLRSARAAEVSAFLARRSQGWKFVATRLTPSGGTPSGTPSRRGLSRP